MSTNSGLRTPFALLSSYALTCLLFVSLGCGDSVECVVDTDCELGNRCEAQACVPLSTSPQRDSGPVPDVPVEEDAGPEDTGPPDTGAADDVGLPDDGGLVDGSVDAGPPPACDFDGMYSASANAENPSVCNSLALTECSVTTVDGATTATCGATVTECTYDDDCVCAGVATSGIMFTADFSNLTLMVASETDMCSYALAAL